MAIPKVGTKAPVFKSVNQAGEAISSADYKGKTLVLYFYPKDNTPGCTVQACALKDGHKKILAKGAAVVGVSPDSPKSHVKFIEKFDLPFDLISDEDKSVCKAFGVWVKKSMYGKEYMGVARTTFIIDGKGVITHVFEKVKPAEHLDDVLAVLKK
ncbi:MAG: thioredoxin-dependent thiol peroxidase [Candidatus Omnitrophica bacterium]|nr:thioredoxin-dependent thiol peroxidase [Candidatus Omnitrophota bacterium]